MAAARAESNVTAETGFCAGAGDCATRAVEQQRAMTRERSRIAADCAINTRATEGTESAALLWPWEDEEGISALSGPQYHHRQEGVHGRPPPRIAPARRLRG